MPRLCSWRQNTLRRGHNSARSALLTWKMSITKGVVALIKPSLDSSLTHTSPSLLTPTHPCSCRQYTLRWCHTWERSGWSWREPPHYLDQPRGGNGWLWEIKIEKELVKNTSNSGTNFGWFSKVNQVNKIPLCIFVKSIWLYIYLHELGLDVNFILHF